MTSTDTRCEITDLDTRWCAHCLKLPDVEVWDERVTHASTRWARDEPEAVPAIEAQYDGDCSVCNDRIKPGQMILRLTTGGAAPFVHAECAVSAE